jgi:hypothetical protein
VHFYVLSGMLTHSLRLTVIRRGSCLALSLIPGRSQIADSVSRSLVLSSLVIVHQNTQLWPLP